MKSVSFCDRQQKRRSLPPDGDNFYVRSLNVLKDPEFKSKQTLCHEEESSPSSSHSPSATVSTSDSTQRKQTSCQVYKIVVVCPRVVYVTLEGLPLLFRQQDGMRMSVCEGVLSLSHEAQERQSCLSMQRILSREEKKAFV